MAKQLALAEAYAEATSAPKHVVLFLSLACMRFHTEVLELLLAVPRPKRGQEEQGKTGGKRIPHGDSHQLCRRGR